MVVIVMTAKAAVAAALLIGGGAKLADLTGFTAVVRLLLPARVPGAGVRATALAAACAEVMLGAASLSMPGAGWVNLPVFALTCGFVGVSVLGYLRHRGRPCQCFGALSSRRFGVAGLAQAAAMAAAAGAGLAGMPPALAGLSIAGHVLLLLAGLLVAVAASSAARAAALAQRLRLETP